MSHSILTNLAPVAGVFFFFFNNFASTIHKNTKTKYYIEVGMAKKSHTGQLVLFVVKFASCKPDFRFKVLHTPDTVNTMHMVQQQFRK